MEAEIAKLLNCSKEDKDGLRGLLEEYLFESDSDQSDGESSCLNEFTDDDDESAVDYDMQKNDLDTVLETAKQSAEVVVEFDDELEKVKKFWYVSDQFFPLCCQKNVGL